MTELSEILKMKPTFKISGRESHLHTPFLSYLFTLLGYIPCWVLPCLSVANDSATSVIKKQVLEKKEEKEEV